MVNHVPDAFRKQTTLHSDEPHRMGLFRYIVWRLVFTKQNEMDLGYAFLIPFLALFFVAWVHTAKSEWTVTAPMWTALVSVIGSMLLATIPKDRARIMRDRSYDMGYSSPAVDPFSTPPEADAR
jgi:hypothetical protein